MKGIFKKVVLLIVIWLVLWCASLLIPAAFMPDEAEIPKVVSGICLIVTLFITLGSALVIDYNRAQKFKAGIPGFKKDVEALEERREHQLEQANKVLDKFLAHEKGIQEAVASSHVESAAEFRVKVHEQYPELASNQAVATLLSQIEKVEAELVRKKEQLNTCISDYNASIHSFPVVMVRKLAKLEDYVLESSIEDVLSEEAISDEELGI